MYDTALMEKESIHVLEWLFDEAVPPSNQITDNWLSLEKLNFCEEPGCCASVHCFAGHGRAPMLVCLGMKYKDAVEIVRQKQPLSFNIKRLLYLEKYHYRMCLYFKDINGQ